MVRNGRIELLAPARSLDVGVAAINHGADAVYIGADRFGARVAAGNGVGDIERLAVYAHRYGARVYVTLNTVLYDGEVEAARRLVYELYNAGVDALIVQDMSLLMMDLPPIALHASTQCDNRTVEKVRWLERCGFEQVVLARETSVEMMRRIAGETSVALEAFVHGALCVCYSGQCYMSEAVKGRSANRGECAQMCRLPYSLSDDEGRVYARERHLLSLKDFDASRSLKEMIDAGIASFKIEGRLKDESYVKNVTAYYRRRLDAILEGDGERRASSSGRTRFFFEPDTRKTFFRGATEYFLHGRKPDIWQFDTPKSMGEPVGRVRDVWRNALSVEGGTRFANGDGLCYVDARGEFVGFRVNRVEEGRLIPLRMPDVKRGTQLYRNSDVEFEKVLRGRTAERRVALRLTVTDVAEGVRIAAVDGDGYESEVSVLAEDLQPPTDAVRAERVWREQLMRLGDTIYAASEVDLSGMGVAWFVPVSRLADARRRLAERHTEARLQAYVRERAVCSDAWECRGVTRVEGVDLSGFPTDYRANVANRLAREFYRIQGIEVRQRAFELEHCEGVELMRTRHCIRYAMGWCAKSPGYSKSGGAAPRRLFLENKDGKFELAFDCSRCEMMVRRV